LSHFIALDPAEISPGLQSEQDSCPMTAVNFPGVQSLHFSAPIASEALPF